MHIRVCVCVCNWGGFCKLKYTHMLTFLVLGHVSIPVSMYVHVCIHMYVHACARNSVTQHTHPTYAVHSYIFYPIPFLFHFYRLLAVISQLVS